jgi:hypothetical protein
MVQPASQFNQMWAASMTRYRITINGSNKTAIADLRKYSIDVSDHGARFAPDVGFTVTAFAASGRPRKT